MLCKRKLRLQIQSVLGGKAPKMEKNLLYTYWVIDKVILESITRTDPLHPTGQCGTKWSSFYSNAHIKLQATR